MAKIMRKLAVVVAGVGILASIGPLSLATAHVSGNAPGNNGTVKIDGIPFDDAPNNEPHVGCSFQIDFYGYDQGDLHASVLLQGWPPTGGGTLASDSVFIGQDAAGGGTDLDASRTYDLSSALKGIQPQPNQGWHIKATVNADGSIGSDVKHKVFWVSGCQPSGGGTPPPPPPGGGGDSGSGPPPGPPPAKPAGPVAGQPSFTG
jgi:hypothetical protein